MMKLVNLQLAYERQMDPEDSAKELLVLPGLVWPQKCACCLEKTGGETQALERKVSLSGNQQAFIRMQVPYCKDCQEHAYNASRLVVPTLVLGIVLLVVIVFILFSNGLMVGNSMGYGIVFFLFLVVTLFSFGVYRLVRKRMAEDKMKETCSHHAWAVTVPKHSLMEGDQIELVFVFDNDVYGEEFESLNVEEPEGEEEESESLPTFS